jgi:low temperature requirement protein LtrA
MTDRTTAEAARFDRMFLLAFIPIGLFMAASLYVRITQDADPLWTGFSTPLFIGAIGVRALLRPAPPESRRTLRIAGVVLLVLAAVILTINVLESSRPVT